MKKSLKVDLIKFIVCLSSFYLAIAPFGLSHVCFFFGFLLLLKNSFTKTNDSSICWLFIFILFSAFQIYIGANWKALLNNISSMMMYIIVVDILKHASLYRIRSVSNSFIKYTTWILIVECIVRLITSVPHGISLYTLKLNSFMFFDTNFCGLLVLVLICFIHYLVVFQGMKELKKYKIVNIFLLLLSLSRAAILGYIVFELLFFRLNSKNWRKYLIRRLIVISIIGLVAGGIFLNFAMQDNSFRSKLYILGLIQENLSNIYDIAITGIGYDHGQQFLGIYPHNYFLLYIIETGIIGVSLKITYILYILYRTNWFGLYIIIPYLIPIQSASGYATHYLFVVLGLITLLVSNNKINYKSNEKKSIGLYCNS